MRSQRYRHQKWCHSKSAELAAAAPESTGFWIVTQEHDPAARVRARVTAARPLSLWDAATSQLRATPIPHRMLLRDRLKVVDGLLDVIVDVRASSYTLDWKGRRTTKRRRTRPTDKTARLVVGRYAPSHLVRPAPWCQLLGPDDAATDTPATFARFVKSVEDKADIAKNMHAASMDLGVLAVDFVTGGLARLTLKASVRPREVSGIFNRVVKLDVAVSRDEGSS